MTLSVKGVNGILTFDGSFITITRTGMARLTIGKVDKRIPLTSVTGVEWKPAGAIMNGYLQLTIPGGVERRSQFGSRTFDAAKDENTVVFHRGQQPQFEQICQAIEQALAQRIALTPTGTHASHVSIADELAKLGQLMQQGVLTKEEFDAAKAQLLAPS